MGNPLLTFWHRLHAVHEEAPGGVADSDAAPGAPGGVPGRHPAPGGAPTGRAADAAPSTAAIFLVLRRMRVPLIVLIAVFSISVLGLTIIPGRQADGGTEPMGFFDAFYFMSYTATTIGFGEIPDPLTPDQRLWVTFSIYLAVIGWAYALGTLFALLGDRGFRKALDTRRFARQVSRIPEPFRIVVGYGEAGVRVVRSLDAKGSRLVVVDRSQDRIDALELAALRCDVPALGADTRAPATLLLAGLGQPNCVGVLALTDDDEANLCVVQTVHLIRPGIAVVARARTAQTSRQMAPFGAPTVVNPDDSFGDRLRIALRRPSLSQLLDWLVLPPGEPLPARTDPPIGGRWLLVGSDAVVAAVTADLVGAGIDVEVAEPGGPSASDDAFADRARRASGVIVVADRDTETISLVGAARRANPTIMVVARAVSPRSSPLFAALSPDVLLLPAEVVAREVLERLVNPLLWVFLQRAERQSEAWAAAVRDELVDRVGLASPFVWEVRVDNAEAPALTRRLARGPVRLGELMASPWGRAERLRLMVLMRSRGGEHVLVPGPDVEVDVGDVLLLAGAGGTQRALDETLFEVEALSYVLHGRAVATTWWGRWLFGSRRA